MGRPRKSPSMTDGKREIISRLIIAVPSSQPQLKKNIVKMEIDEIRESRRIRKWKEGFREETETSMGGFLIDSHSPLGCRFPP